MMLCRLQSWLEIMVPMLLTFSQHLQANKYSKTAFGLKCKIDLSVAQSFMDTRRLHLRKTEENFSDDCRLGNQSTCMICRTVKERADEM